MTVAMRTAVAVWLLAAALVGLVAAAAPRLDQPVGNLTRDPQGILGVGWYFGFLSNVGVLLWWGTAVVCVLAGGIVWKLGARRRGQIAIAVGLFTAWLTLDDLFLLHEDVLPRALLLSEEVILVVYALVAVGVLWSVRALLQRDTGILLAAAVLLFFVSTVVDFYGSWADTTLYLYEDALKFVGIVTWCVTFVFVSLRLLSEGILLASGTRNPPIRISRSSPVAERDESTATR